MPTRCRAGSRCCRAKSMDRLFPATLLADELLAADDADLREPEPLRRRHHAGNDAVFGELVRTQMNLGLHGLLRGGTDLRFERRAIGNDLAVPVHLALVVDVELDDFGQRDRW